MSFASLAHGHRWIWSAAGTVVLWTILSLTSNQFGIQSVLGVAAAASFLAIAAIGQTFAVSTGGGNVDLSIASVITLSAFVTMSFTNGSDLGLLLSLPAVVFMGIVVGQVNAFLVLRLRIPAIIATLAVGYVLATATLLANRFPTTYVVSPVLKALGAGRFFGVPNIIFVTLAVVAVAWLLIERTAFGRILMAIGQSEPAARLAGIRVGRVVTLAFMISGVLAALDGALLSAHSSGAFLDMGTPYLLQSVGAVVVGGTLIFGGSATPIGTFFASIFLVLIVTTLQIMRAPGGVQDVVQGLVIIAILATAGAGVVRKM